MRSRTVWPPFRMLCSVQRNNVLWGAWGGVQPTNANQGVKGFLDASSRSIVSAHSCNRGHASRRCSEKRPRPLLSPPTCDRGKRPSQGAEKYLIFLLSLSRTTLEDKQVSRHVLERCPRHFGTQSLIFSFVSDLPTFAWRSARRGQNRLSRKGGVFCDIRIWQLALLAFRRLKAPQRLCERFPRLP